MLAPMKAVTFHIGSAHTMMVPRKPMMARTKPSICRPRDTMMRSCLIHLAPEKWWSRSAQLDLSSWIWAVARLCWLLRMTFFKVESRWLPSALKPARFTNPARFFTLFSVHKGEVSTRWTSAVDDTCKWGQWSHAIPEWNNGLLVANFRSGWLLEDQVQSLVSGSKNTNSGVSIGWLALFTFAFYAIIIMCFPDCSWTLFLLFSNQNYIYHS